MKNMEDENMKTKKTTFDKIHEAVWNLSMIFLLCFMVFSFFYKTINAPFYFSLGVTVLVFWIYLVGMAVNKRSYEIKEKLDELLKSKEEKQL